MTPPNRPLTHIQRRYYVATGTFWGAAEIVWRCAPFATARRVAWVGSTSSHPDVHATGRAQPIETC